MVMNREWFIIKQILTVWSWDLKNCRDFLFSRDNHWTKFGDSEANRSKDIERTTSVKRQVNCPWPQPLWLTTI